MSETGKSKGHYAGLFGDQSSRCCAVVFGESEQTPPAPLYLAADIGGTTSRFALFEDLGDTMRLRSVERIPTSEAKSFSDLLRLLKDGPLGPELSHCRAGALAVAGAVQGGVQADPPNIPWAIDVRSTNLSGLPDTLILLNDFAAQAYACKTAALDEAVTINAGRRNERGMVGVIGAGTGLGHGMLAPLPEQGLRDFPGRSFLAWPSEAGHAAFAFVNREEAAFEDFVRRELGLEYVYGDVVVSGQGLALLHRFHFGQDLRPEQAAAAMDETSPVMSWFARFYGRACRHFALNILATGGIVVTGGVAAKNPGLMRHPEFFREFTDNPNYRALLQDIPVVLNTNQDSGLWGAALAAKLAARRRPTPSATPPEPHGNHETGRTCAEGRLVADG
ncbi:glucokinase [Desulfonatronum lacustre]|uniref:glucokinase n=1 Tax=Desulfonatronum lacustre TaxID=66849 RepID=UPI0004B45D3C|nr:glucokinase [Desulfonatronum lacustre]